MIMPRLLISCLCTMFCVWVLELASPAAAQVAQEQPNETPLADPLGRDTPRGMIDGLVDALSNDDYPAAAAFLDLSNVPEPARVRQGPIYARALQLALDQSGGILPTYRLSTQPEGLTGDGLPQDADVFANISDGGQLKDLVAVRVEALEGTLIWLVAPETLQLVSAATQVVRTGIVDRFTPEALRGQRWLGAPVAHWVALGALALACLLVARAVTRVFLLAISLFSAELRRPHFKAFATAILRPLAFIMATLLFSAFERLLGVSFVARSTIAPGLEIVMWLALGWLLWRMVDVAAQMGLAEMSRRGRQGAISVVALARRTAKFVIMVLFAIAAANSLGLNLTGWLAAFGLGGLAVALGAQKTIENFVGSLSLIADQPVRVGDFCEIDGIWGTVEDIGIRSTRLRTLTNTLVTIPNGTVSGAAIQNFAGREQFLYRHTIGLTYETTGEQMRATLWRLRSLLEGHDAVDPETLRVNFKGFAASSLDIEIYCYLKAPSYADFLAQQEDLNLSVMEVVEECGTEFAFPSQTIYMAGSGEPKV